MIKYRVYSVPEISSMLEKHTNKRGWDEASVSGLITLFSKHHWHIFLTFFKCSITILSVVINTQSYNISRQKYFSLKICLSLIYSIILRLCFCVLHQFYYRCRFVPEILLVFTHIPDVFRQQTEQHHDLQRQDDT